MPLKIDVLRKEISSVHTDNEAGYRNELHVPTHWALKRSVRVVQTHVSTVYEYAEHISNQGTDHHGCTAVGRLRRRGYEEPKTSFAIKQENIGLSTSLRTIPKPRHPNIVSLYCFFRQHDSISFVYERLDMPLSEIFATGTSSQTCLLSEGNDQIGAIFRQVNVSDSVNPLR